MDIKLKYKAWVEEKHADIASPLSNSDIETFAIEFAEWLVKNCNLQIVSKPDGTVCECCGNPLFLLNGMKQCTNPICLKSPY